jgi:hypothetical protein
MPPKPPADEWGRWDPLTKEPATRCEEEGRTEPATLRGFPVDSEPWCCDPKAFLCCSGREKPWASWRVTTRIPGLGGLTMGAWVSASEAAMVFSVVGVVAPALGWPFSSLSVMVDVEGEREKALRGPRCVSLSSVAICQPSGGGLRGGQATPRSKQTLCELPRHDGQMDLVWSDQTTGVARGAKRSDE